MTTPTLHTAGSFIVMCSVSGGVTGSREAPMKSGGKVLTFPTWAAADAEAQKHNSRPRSPYSLACYNYWVERS